MEKVMLKDLTILVNSCEKYSDGWEPFFKLFSSYGEELKKCKIMFNSERTIYKYEGLNIDSTANYRDTTGLVWGDRLKFALSKINTKYVLFLLEDFYLRENVNVGIITECINWLDKFENVVCFNLESLLGADIESENFPNFCLIKTGIEYRVNAQPAIWRKEILDRSILAIESPWDWEIYGNKRNDVVLKNVELYSLKWGVKEPFFTDFYNFSKKDLTGRYLGRSGIMRGKWYVKFIDPLFKKHNIIVDYNKMGIYKFKKRCLLLRIAAALTRPLRRKKILRINKTNEKMEKFVNPYIK